MLSFIGYIIKCILGTENEFVINTEKIYMPFKGHPAILTI